MLRAEQTLDRRARGDAIEAAALDFLLAEGLRLLARNARSRGGELDLVMLAPGEMVNTVVFVEVRYRASHAFGGGAASVDLAKRRKLVRAAQAFGEQEVQRGGFDGITAGAAIECLLSARHRPKAPARRR